MFRSTKVIDPKTPILDKMVEEVNQNIQVFVRCRPLNINEKKASIDLIPEKKAIKTSQQNKLYSFDNVFDHNAKQLDVYLSVVEPLVEQVIEGYNCTVFAYGQTGTGKTYTMIGDRSDQAVSWEEDPKSGIIPRAIDQLIDDLQNQNTEYTIRVSFLELYNEEAYDLLSPLSDNNKLRIYNDSERKGSVIISGLVEMIVETKAEIFEILKKGSLKRQTAPTLMNACSSRSHSIFSVTVHIKETALDGEEVVKMGKLNLVDLAGSENIGRSGAIEERAREASNINKSLLTLGRVITSLVEKSSHIPYRDSKLTRLLQDSLGGKTKTSIIATISPGFEDLEDTISTLDYAQRAKKITNKPEINLKLTKKTLISEYVGEIDRLRRDLEAARDKKGIFIDAKNYKDMEETLKTQEKSLEIQEARILNMKDELEKHVELLSKTNQNLDVKCQELEDTQSRLSQLIDELNETKLHLSGLVSQLEEKKILLEAHSKTEEKLLNKAELILRVTDRCMEEKEKLFNKLDTYSSIESHNKNLCDEFKTDFNDENDKISFFNELLLSTLNKGHDCIENLIVNEKNILLEKNKVLKNEIESFEANFNGFENRFYDIIAKEKTRFVDSKSEVIGDISKFKEDILSKFSLIKEKILNDDRTMQLLDLIVSENSRNLSKNEESVGEQISIVTEMSKNMTQKIQHIDQSFKKAYDEKCTEVENLRKEIGNLKALVGNAQLNEKLKDVIGIINTISTQYTDQMGSIQNSANHIEEIVGTMARNDSQHRDSHTFQNAELVQSIVNVNEKILSGLENLDQSHTQQSRSILEKCDHIKATNQDLKSKHEQISNKTEDSIDSFTDKLTFNIDRIEQIISDCSKIKLQQIENFGQQSTDFVATAFSILNDMSFDVENLSTKTLNEYDNVVANSKALNFSQKMKIDECQEKVESLFTQMKTYFPTGQTPKPVSYSYPATFTPTSPHERILARHRTNLMKPENIFQSPEVNRDNGDKNNDHDADDDQENRFVDSKIMMMTNEKDILTENDDLENQRNNYFELKKQKNRADHQKEIFFKRNFLQDRNK